MSNKCPRPEIRFLGLTRDSCVLVVEQLVKHEFFRLPDGVEYDRLAVVPSVRSHSEANLARVGVFVEGIWCIKRGVKRE